MPVTLSYLILATPRSGSGLLCQALENTNLAGRPKEYFGIGQQYWSQRWGVADSVVFVDRLLAERSTPNGVFGAKMLWRQLLRFEQSCRTLPAYRDAALPALLAGLFPDLHYVWIERHDKVRQAISYWKAKETGLWSRSAKRPEAPAKRAEFDFAGIDDLLRTVEADEAGIAEFFRQTGIEPFRVVYEDFIDAYTETVAAILDWLGIAVPAELPVLPPRTVRLADDETEEWVARFHRIKTEQDEAAAARR